ncbi:hypothetical protein H5410_060656 [Solanum commersonii]|uniref:Uncharacterized protein n=1 Tax=Solanum commersonii TaxID=4109 RepID=A0A9J5W5U4_SOLCO|nr:hypothetical protein H5410_060656 [Solanum commersonii]
MYSRENLIYVKLLNKVFMRFSKASKLHANLDKNSLYITGVADHTKKSFNFLWTVFLTVSKKALVSWETICKPHAGGGLNIMDLCLWNRVAILKQLWNLARRK